MYWGSNTWFNMLLNWLLCHLFWHDLLHNSTKNYTANKTNLHVRWTKSLQTTLLAVILVWLMNWKDFPNQIITTGRKIQVPYFYYNIFYTNSTQKTFMLRGMMWRKKLNTSHSHNCTNYTLYIQYIHVCCCFLSFNCKLLLQTEYL